MESNTNMKQQVKLKLSWLKPGALVDISDVYKDNLDDEDEGCDDFFIGAFDEENDPWNPHNGVVRVNVTKKPCFVFVSSNEEFLHFLHIDSGMVVSVYTTWVERFIVKHNNNNNNNSDKE